MKVLPDTDRILTHIYPALQLTNLEFAVDADMLNQIMIAPYTTVEHTLQHGYNKHGIIKYRREVCYRETGLFQSRPSKVREHNTEIYQFGKGCYVFQYVWYLA